MATRIAADGCRCHARHDRTLITNAEEIAGYLHPSAPGFVAEIALWAE